VESNQIVKVLQAAVKKGDPFAHGALAFMYFNGKEVEKDEKKSNDLLIKGAALGDPECQFTLGCQYFGGRRGFAQDEAKAYDLFTKAVAQGHIKAAHNLALCFDQGRGVDQDFTRAAEMYYKAAENGVAESMFGLGVCYEKGRGMLADTQKARDWYKKAADKGLDAAVKKLETLG